MLTDLPTFERLLTSVRSSRRSVHVLGDAISDEYVYGSLTRITPEGGAPVFQIASEVLLRGGAGNLMQQFLAWNASATLSSTGSNLKRRIIADGKLLLVESRDGPRHPPLAFATTSPLDAIVVADYDKGAITPEVAQLIGLYAKERGVRLIVDPSPSPGTDNDFRWSGADLVKMNRDQWARRRTASPGAWLEARNIDWLVITNGPLPPTVFSRSHARLAVGDLPCPLSAIDTAGAGDHFAAVLTMALLHGLTVWQATEIAHGASKLRVAYRRPRPILPTEILGCYYPPLRKIMTAAEARQLLHGKVVFTNGRFRMGLTAGHCSLLDFAKAQGDTLVVGINSDASCERGWLINKQPAMPQEQRARIVASNANVDFVIVYDDDTPVETMRALGSIDTLVKGDEYAHTEVPGSDLARQVLFAPTVFPQHTSDFLRMANV